MKYCKIILILTKAKRILDTMFVNKVTGVCGGKQGH